MVAYYARNKTAPSSQQPLRRAARACSAVQRPQHILENIVCCPASRPALSLCSCLHFDIRVLKQRLSVWERLYLPTRLSINLCIRSCFGVGQSRSREGSGTRWQITQTHPLRRVCLEHCHAKSRSTATRSLLLSHLRQLLRPARGLRVSSDADHIPVTTLLSADLLACNLCSVDSSSSTGFTELPRDVTGSQDTDLDLLEVQVSGKSARSARHFQGRPSLCHLRSAPASALVAAAEQAVADHAASSGCPPAFNNLTTSSYGSSNSSGTPGARYPRSQSHMDLPRHGSEAIEPSSMPSTSGQHELAPLVRAQSRNLQTPFAAAQLPSPAAAPAVQQAQVQQPPSPFQTASLPATTNTGNTMSRRLSRKISNHRMIVSQSRDMQAQDGEFMLPPETAAFAHAGPASTDDLEVCFSGKSARAFRSMVRPTDLTPVTAH